MYSEYTEEVDANLKDWKVKSMSDTEIEISVEFKDPLQVSTGWEPDKLIIDVNLAPYQNKQNIVRPRTIIEIDVPP